LSVYKKTEKADLVYSIIPVVIFIATLFIAIIMHKGVYDEFFKAGFFGVSGHLLKYLYNNWQSFDEADQKPHHAKGV
jgi:hypothetical protein